MDALNSHIREYTSHLRKGNIQKAYRGILSFMSGLRAGMESRFPDCSVSGLYAGYIDMTYYACTPSALKDRQLKIPV